MPDDRVAADDDTAEGVDDLAGMGVEEDRAGPRETLSASRKRVAIRSSGGKALNSSGSRTFSATSRIVRRERDVQDDQDVQQRRRAAG